MKIKKLLLKGRLKPVVKVDGSGNAVLVGYERRPGSRKKHQSFTLKKPQVIAKVVQT